MRSSIRIELISAQNRYKAMAGSAPLEVDGFGAFIVNKHTDGGERSNLTHRIINDNI